MAKTNTARDKTIDLDSTQAHRVTEARKALDASQAPGWQDDKAGHLGRLEATVELLLQTISELTGGAQ